MKRVKSLRAGIREVPGEEGKYQYAISAGFEGGESASVDWETYGPCSSDDLIKALRRLADWIEKDQKGAKWEYRSVAAS